MSDNAVELLVIGALIILFAGDPDIADGIIDYLQYDKTESVNVQFQTKD